MYKLFFYVLTTFVQLSLAKFCFKSLIFIDFQLNLCSYNQLRGRHFSASRHNTHEKRQKHVGTHFASTKHSQTNHSQTLICLNNLIKNISLKKILINNINHLSNRWKFYM